MPKRYTVEEFLLTYVSWQSMLQRCVYKGQRKDAALYRDRGVTVCPRWRDFSNFIEDMGPRPGRGFTLDRFPDRGGGYAPSNCRWATAKQQAANTRSARLLTLRGETHPIAEWGRLTGLGRATIQLRLKNGWSVDAALLTPVGERNPSYKTFAEGRALGKKLTAEQVQEIVSLAKAGGHTARGLGRSYGVSGSSICHILKQFSVCLKKGRPRKC